MRIIERFCSFSYCIENYLINYVMNRIIILIVELYNSNLIVKILDLTFFFSFLFVNINKR